MRYRVLSRTLCTALALLAIALPLCAQKKAKQHNPKRPVREQILALEEQWRLAQLTGDVPVMDKLLSEDYLGITSAGLVVTKSQQLQRVRSRSISFNKLDFSDIKIKVINQTAIVTLRADIVGANENGLVEGGFRYTRVYQRLPSGVWKITSFESTRILTPEQRRGRLPTGSTPKS